MKGFIENIDALTEDNNDYRRVLYTGKHMQLVLMSLAPGDEIGEEVHHGHDQFFRIEVGQGELIIDDVIHQIKEDDGIIVPSGAKHNVINSGSSPLKLYTLYSPPEHQLDVRHPTKADDKAQHFDGRTTE